MVDGKSRSFAAFELCKIIREEARRAQTVDPAKQFMMSPDVRAKIQKLRIEILAGDSDVTSPVVQEAIAMSQLFEHAYGHAEALRFREKYGHS